VRNIFSVILLLAFFTLSLLFSSTSGLAQKGSYVREALEGAVFIYDASSNPCDPAPPGKTLLPLGSGVIATLRAKSPESSPAERPKHYRFLITAQHVIGNRDSIILRLNQADKPEFACHPVNIIRQGNGSNVFTSPKPEVDLIAISIPAFPNTRPTVFDYSLILDEELMEKQEVWEGTDIFTVGYLYSYSGKKQNYPVAKFGKIAMLTKEVWYRSPKPRNMDEEAYLVELENAPGLSGAPVMVLSPQIRVGEQGQLQYRRISPLIIGVIKGLLPSPVGGTQGVAAIGPGYHLRELLKKIADELQAVSVEVELGSATME
jgi:hypothetical protein